MAMVPFAIFRRVGWGECDPALIYYTPHAIDYAAEATEAWFEEILGVSLLGLAAEYGFDAHFLRIDCSYLKPLVASQRVELRATVSDVDDSRLVLAVSGDDPGGQLCFMVRMVVGFVTLHERRPVPMPAVFKTALGACRQQDANCQGAHPNFDWSNFPVADGTAARTFPRLSDGSYLGSRRVAYGDCGTAGIVCAPKLFVYAVEAVGEWFETILGISWMQLVWERTQGAPFVSVSCQYLLPILPGEKLALAVEVTRMGRSSLEFAVSGCNPKGELCFYAVLTSCFVERQGGLKAISIPEEFREKIRVSPAASGDTGHSC